VYRTLVAHDLERHELEPPTHTFEATGSDTRDFIRLAHRFLGPEVVRVEAASHQHSDTGAIALGNQ
jgi:glutamate racemase